MEGLEGQKEQEIHSSFIACFNQAKILWQEIISLESYGVWAKSLKFPALLWRMSQDRYRGAGAQVALPNIVVLSSPALALSHENLRGLFWGCPLVAKVRERFSFSCFHVKLRNHPPMSSQLPRACMHGCGVPMGNEGTRISCSCHCFFILIFYWEKYNA